MEIDQIINQNKTIYEFLFKYITSDSESETIESYQQLINLIDTFIKENNHDRIQEFLSILAIISKNHHYDTCFFSKIKKILFYLKDYIKQTFSNYEIFEKFKNDKRVLLYLFKSEIIEPDESIFNFIYSEQTEKFSGFHFDIFFYPEMKKFFSLQNLKEVEEDLSNYDSSIFDNFENKREKGENEDYLCELIRSDSVEEFIQYLNKKNISVNSKIEPSIFESNLFLIQNDPTLIEYAAFFGSIQIFQFLKFSNVELNNSLWTYAIHSKNGELIHLLEENSVEAPFNSYNCCLKEAVKCHHNEIATYFIDNLMDKNDVFDVKKNFYTNIFSYCYRFHNFHFYQDNLEDKYTFLYLCQFNYLKLVKLYLEYKNIDVNYIIKIELNKFK